MMIVHEANDGENQESSLKSRQQWNDKLQCLLPGNEQLR
jgi:hypothetical protein